MSHCSVPEQPEVHPQILWSEQRQGHPWHPARNEPDLHPQADTAGHVGLWQKGTETVSAGWSVGSVGRVSDSRSEDPRFRARWEHKKNLWEFFWVKNCYAVLLLVCPTPRVYAHIRMIMYACLRSCSPCPEFGGLRKTAKAQHALYNLLGLGSLTVVAGFPWGKQPKFPVANFSIGTRKC